MKYTYIHAYIHTIPYKHFNKLQHFIMQMTNQSTANQGKAKLCIKVTGTEWHIQNGKSFILATNKKSTVFCRQASWNLERNGGIKQVSWCLEKNRTFFISSHSWILSHFDCVILYSQSSCLDFVTKVRSPGFVPRVTDEYSLF